MSFRMIAREMRRTKQSSILDELLTSSTRARLLSILLTHPSQEYYLRELHRRSGQSLRAVQHELARLERLGLVLTQRRGREKFYRANDKHPLFMDLKRIIYKTTGLGAVLQSVLHGAKGIETAFVYGSVAKGGERATSDVDLMVVGNPNSGQLHRALAEAENSLGREISLTVMSPEEWRERRRSRDGFVTELLKSKKIVLVGDEQALRGA